MKEMKLESSLKKLITKTIKQRIKINNRGQKLIEVLGSLCNSCEYHREMGIHYEKHCKNCELNKYFVRIIEKHVVY